MSTLEHLFMQIFDRKDWIVEQMKQQLESYEQSVVWNLAANGRRPPDWILSNGSGSGSDVAACCNLTELNGKQIIPDILFPSSRFTTPSNRNTFSIPSLNLPQTFTNITNKQIHKDRISEEEIPKPQLENCNESEPYNSNPAIQIPDSVTQRSRSRQRFIATRLSAEQKAKSSKNNDNNAVFKPSGGSNLEELLVKESGVDFVDQPVCTENDAVEPKRLSFDAVVLGNLVVNNNNNNDDSIAEKQDGAIEISSNLACENGYLVEKENEAREISSNLGCENESLVAKKDEAMEISSLILEKKNCEINRSGMREVKNEFYEHNSLSDIQMLDTELNESSNCIENHVAELKNPVCDEPVASPSSLSDELACDTIEQEPNNVLNSTEIKLEQAEKPDSYEPTEEQNCTENDAAELENPEPTEIPDCTENDANELEKTVIDESAEIPNCTENDATELANPALSEPTEIQDCTENDADRLENRSMNEPTEIMDCTENDAAGFANLVLNEPTEIPICTENDATGLENPGFNEPTEIPDCMENDVSELEKTYVDESADILNCTENDAAGLENPSLKEPTEIQDRTENDATGPENPALNQPTEITDCTQNDANGLENPALNEPTGITDCTENDATELEIPALSEITEIPNCTENDATRLVNPVLNEPTEIQDRTENDATELQKTACDEPTEKLNCVTIYASLEKSAEIPNCTTIDAAFEKPAFREPTDMQNELEMLVARDSYASEEKDETLICTENDAVELRTEEETWDSVGEMGALVYARDSYSPTGNRTEDSNNNNNSNNNDNNNNILLDPKVETETDPRSISHTAKSVLLQSDEGIKRIESGGKYTLKGSISIEKNNNSIKRQVDVQIHVDVNSSPKRRKFENFFSDSALAASSGKMKEKEQSFTEPSYLLVEKGPAEEAQLQTEEMNFSEPNYSPVQTNQSESPQPPVEQFNFSTNSLSQKGKSPLQNSTNSPISPYKTELECFKTDQEVTMPELEGFSMEISPISEDQTANCPEMLSLAKEQASLLKQLFSGSKNASSSGAHLYQSVPTDIFNLMKSTDPFYTDIDKTGPCYSSCRFESTGSGSGLSFSGKCEKPAPFTPPAGEKFGQRKLEISSGKTSSGKFHSSTDLTCFRIDEDYGIEDADVPNDRNAPQESLPEMDISEEDVNDSQNDQNALEESVVERDISEGEDMDVTETEIDRNALEGNLLEEAEASQQENDRKALRDVTAVQNIEAEGVAPVCKSVAEGRGQNRNYASMKPKHSAASSIKGLNEVGKKVLKPTRSNIVSNVQSFVPLVKQKQQPVIKKREIRVPALEAAEAKRRQDEKKRNEKEMQKAEREKEMKRKQEETKRKQEEEKRKQQEETKRKQEEIKRKQEEEKRKQEEIKRKQEEEQRKKKEEEMANRKRQREERERREKEKEREKRRKVAELVEKERSVAVPKVFKDEKEVGPSSSVVNNYKIEIPKVLQKEKEYEMSPYVNSDEEGSDADSEEEKRRKSKFVPPWTKKESFQEYFMSKLCFEPAEILFSSKQAFDCNALKRSSKKKSRG